jgi:hypothetical protein
MRAGVLALLALTACGAATTPPSRASGPALDPAPAPPPLAPGPGHVRVELDQPGTELQETERWSAGRTRWFGVRGVCAAPCAADVPEDGMYRVAGAGMPPSSSFALPARDLVHLAVSPGRGDLHDAGGLLTLVGGLTTAVGAGLLLGPLGAGASAEPGGAYVPTACAIAGVGVAGLVTGIALLLGNATTVRFE